MCSLLDKCATQLSVHQLTNGVYLKAFCWPDNLLESAKYAYTLYIIEAHQGFICWQTEALVLCIESCNNNSKHVIAAWVARCISSQSAVLLRPSGILAVLPTDDLVQDCSISSALTTEIMHYIDMSSSNPTWYWAYMLPHIQIMSRMHRQQPFVLGVLFLGT